MKYNISLSDELFQEWLAIFEKKEKAWDIYYQYNSVNCNHFERSQKALHKLKRELALKDYNLMQKKADEFIANYNTEIFEDNKTEKET